MIFSCIICNNVSFEIICKNCQKEFLKPEIKFKDNIVSFYEYEEISFLIKYKYEKFGSSVFKILAKNSLKLFVKEFKEKAFVIPIDDKIDKGFSHTAILVKSMKTKYLTPLFFTLHSTNNFQYAGKNLEERLKNPRNFKYIGPKNIDVILVDDITTTGLTLQEAKEVLQHNKVNVLFSVVLAR
ncbi:ComF family protein [Caminibacter mediatlanticus TB-2]|uniref:ComF family protein n=1 Tax=Caminibacter mediatlanticus TB-2 TaxID=391592 RepID=A0ABX5VBD7_9BACT|nr:ComF family protein [Caminibacter mediatlanticus]QCT94827.1 ComF family protein [Caminibacter mediatlanticus TB-2]